ncbi:four-helix bundle copper-binding protein [Legionella maioricensis]|uniref:Four-helix bundle copper-binding protein n=1 Tax=Legionella maioricensis TaxID=2896528 RepID=A0A9X2CYJ9_9GAMM|nr:four-helix bundle copper-binding protein [Legionella maioricensis]MCL9682878.1 four-helix bundle copper-binding protein [Legionella maioricensis]MCL9686494.1 four-helix bundle copper-binding protein [Legionella maioricensis]
MMAHEQYQTCIEACLACATQCGHCETSCINEDKDKDMVGTFERDRKDCAQLCTLAAEMMTRESKYAQAICSLCAKACRDRAHHMEHCTWCAEACTRCAIECEKIGV